MTSIKDKDVQVAFRLARTIASDIMLYNREKVLQGLKQDTLFEVLEKEIAEGRELYETRVSEDIRRAHNLLDRAIVDVLIRAQAHILCPLW